MDRRNFTLNLLAIGCFIVAATLVPSMGNAQDKVKAAMADLKAMSETLRTPEARRQRPLFRQRQSGQLHC